MLLVAPYSIKLSPYVGTIKSNEFWFNLFSSFFATLLAFYTLALNLLTGTDTSTCTLCRWCFDVELIFLCKWFGIPMIEISVNWSEIPGSKVNLLSIPNMLWELALMSVGYRTRMWKISNWNFSFDFIFDNRCDLPGDLGSRVILALD
jgi:hypothetical protein